jgi:hypothetical protein
MPVWRQAKKRKTEEGVILAHIRELLKRFHIVHWRQQQSLGSVRGVSDIIGIKTVKVDDLVKAGKTHIGVFVAIEVKTARGSLTIDQSAFLKAVEGAGGLAFVARSVQDVIHGMGWEDRFK